MAGTTYVDPFIQQLAQQASALCHLDSNVILAQWQCEQGVSRLSQWYDNNPAGITAGNPAVNGLSTDPSQTSGFLAFPTPAAGAQAYATLYDTDRAYAGVRQAIATGNVVQEMQAIAASSWDTTDGATSISLTPGEIALVAASVTVNGTPIG